MSTGERIKELEHRVAQLERVVANNAQAQGDASVGTELQLIALRYALVQMGVELGFERAGAVYVEGVRKAAVGSYIVDWATQMRETYEHLSVHEDVEEDGTEIFRSTSPAIALSELA